MKIKVKYSMRQNNLIMRSLRKLGETEGFSLITTALSLFILVSLYASITASFNSAFLGLVAQSKTQSNAFAQRAAFETLRPELLETLRFDRFNAKSHIEFIPKSNLGTQAQTIRAVPIEAKINLKLASTETVQKYLASYNVSRESVSDFLRLRQGSHDKVLMLLQQFKGRDIWDHAIFSDNRSRPILANMEKNLIARISPILDATDIRTGGTVDGTIFIKFE